MPIKNWGAPASSMGHTELISLTETVNLWTAATLLGLTKAVIFEIQRCFCQLGVTMVTTVIVYLGKQYWGFII